VTQTQPIPLSAASERDAARREHLVLEHLPQVQWIARRIHNRLPPQVLLEDLIHSGILGLMDAVRKYDPSKKVELKYYAQFRIRGAILDSLRQVDWSPRTLRRQGRRLEQAIVDCKGRLARDPTEIELATELGMSLDQLQHLRGDLRGLNIGSLQADADEPREGVESVQSRPGFEEEDPYHAMLRSEMKDLLTRATDELPARQREVLVLHHFEFLTMKEVGAALGICESRVSQLHTAAISRLRVRLRELMANRPALETAPRPTVTRLLRHELFGGVELPAVRRAS
jgi:RNA polymerase sigma factor FliA